MESNSDLCQQNISSSMKCFSYLILIIFFFVASCDPNRLYEDNKEIPDYSWQADNKIPFEISIIDTGVWYNFYINIRHTSFYQFSNLWVKVYITSPSGKIQEESIELKLAEKDGQWLGSGMGDIWDNAILVQKGLKFRESGNYLFELQQNMRREKLRFIMDVGVRIERNSKR